MSTRIMTPYIFLTAAGLGLPSGRKLGTRRALSFAGSSAIALPHQVKREPHGSN